MAYKAVSFFIQHIIPITPDTWLSRPALSTPNLPNSPIPRSYNRRNVPVQGTRHLCSRVRRVSHYW